MGVVSTGQITLYDANEVPVAALTNEVHAVPSNADGSNPDLSGAVTTLSVLLGTTDITNLYNVSATPSSGITGSLSGTTYTVTGMTVDVGYVDFSAARAGWPTLVKRFSLAKQKQGSPGPQGPAGPNGVDAPRCLGLYAYADRDAITGMIAGDLVVLYSDTQSERGIYSYVSGAWIKQTTPTQDQIMRCFVGVLDAVRQGYGVSSDYVSASVEFDTIFANFIAAQYLYFTKAVYSGAYNQDGDQTSTDPGVHISGITGVFRGKGAQLDSAVIQALKTNVKYAGSWVYGGTWGSKSTVNAANSTYPSLVLLPDGRVLCVYHNYSSDYLVQRIRETNGTWGSETTVNAAISYYSSLVLLPDGRVLCVYSNSSNYLVQRIRETNGTWGSETTVDAASSYRPSLVLLPDGRVLCVYHNGSSDYLVQRIRETNGTWGAESTVNAASSYYSSPVLLPDGRVLCVYGNSSNYLVQRIRETNGTWGAESTVKAASSIYPSLVLLPDGRVLCFYSQGTSPYYLVQRIRETNGTWGSETTVDVTSTQTSSLVLLPAGKILCVCDVGSAGLVQRIDNSAYSVIPIGTFQTDVGAGIVEVGQNSNGTWVKFSDGTMIQYIDITSWGFGGTSTSLDGIYYRDQSLSGQQWTFPTPFVSSYFAVANIRVINGVTWATVGTVVSTYCRWYTWASGSFGATSYSYSAVMAVGRWK